MPVRDMHNVIRSPRDDWDTRLEYGLALINEIRVDGGSGSIPPNAAIACRSPLIPHRWHPSGQGVTLHNLTSANSVAGVYGATASSSGPVDDDPRAPHAPRDRQHETFFETSSRIYSRQETRTSSPPNQTA